MDQCLLAHSFLLLFCTVSAEIISCRQMKTCYECTTRKSWIGRSCRWCPASKSCHAWGAILTNPCRNDQIVEASKCSSPFGEPGHFNETTAIRLLQYSATVYQENVGVCFSNVDGIERIKVFNVNCDIIGHDCLAITAVDRKLKSVVIVFRGTNGWSQLITELTTGALRPAVSYAAGGKVLGYFYDAFSALWPDVRDSIISPLAAHPGYSLMISGHSLGAALASIAAFEASYQGLVDKDRIILYTFGGPRVGNYWFSRAFSHHVPNSWRVVNRRDIVAHIPPCNHGPSTMPCIGWLGGYYHHQWEVFYPKKMSSTGNNVYRVCTGIPYQETKTCSNSYAPRFTIRDHRYYFGFDVKNFCWAQSITHNDGSTSTTTSQATIYHALSTTVTLNNDRHSRMKNVGKLCDYVIRVQGAECCGRGVRKVQFQIHVIGSFNGMKEQTRIFDFHDDDCSGVFISFGNGQQYESENKCLDEVHHARFINLKSNRARLLEAIFVYIKGIMPSDVQGRMPGIRFIASEWQSGEMSPWTNTDTGFLKPEDTKLAVYIFSIKTSTGNSAGISGQYVEAFAGFRGTNGRTRVVSLLEMVYRMKGSKGWFTTE